MTGASMIDAARDKPTSAGIERIGVRENKT